jgi:hypothetical protein
VSEPPADAGGAGSHGTGGRGAANRFSPTGGAAKGTPRYTVTPSSPLPRTAPADVRTCVVMIGTLAPSAAPVTRICAVDAVAGIHSVTPDASRPASPRPRPGP